MKWQMCWVPAIVLFAASHAVARPVSYEEALRLAATAQPALDARELQIEARREAADVADQLSDPRLRAGIMNLPVTGPDFLDPTQMTQVLVGVEQEIPNLAKRRARRLVAEAEVDVAQARLLDTSRNAQVQAGQTWIALAFAERALVVAAEALEEVRDLAPLSDAAVASGSARPAESLDVRRATLELEDAITAIEAQHEAAQAFLVRFIGVDDPLAQGEIPALDVDPDQLRGTLASNPEIILANTMTEQARAAIKLAEAERRPDFGVSASYGIRERRFGDLFSIMGTVTLPLFAERRQEPRIRAARAEAAAASAERADLLFQIEAQFEADLAAWRSAYIQWQRAKDELLPLARQRVDLEMASFAAGRAELLDVVEAIKTLALLEIEILEREQAAVEAAAKLRLTYTEQGL